MDLDEAAKAFREFVAIVKALRTPVTGCPWDLEQTHQTLRRYLVEETYEVLDAIDREDDPHLAEELGDLLLQVVLHAQLADDRAAFSITDVIRGIAEKMVRRHPHVFGSVSVSGSAEVLRNWEQIKAAEKQKEGDSPAAAFDRLPEGLPALMRAQRLGEKAGKLGSEDAAVDALLDEVKEGVAQLRRREDVERDLGDLLFNLCQVARRLGVDAESSLRACNRRFVERFREARNAEQGG